MKKLLYVIGFFVSLCAWGQNEVVLKKYFDLTKNTYDSLQILQKQYLQIKFETEKEARTLYEKNTESLRKTAGAVDALNKSSSALKASLSATEYFSAVAALNNPTNEDLGFRLENEILKVVDEKILKKAKLGTKKISRFRQIVSNIINNPITNLITSNIPVVNSITSVVNLVNHTIIDEDSVTPDDLKIFNQEIKRYVAHYENLARISADLEKQSGEFHIKIEAVESLLNDFVKNASADLFPEAKSLENQSTNDLIRNYFNYAKIDALIKSIEKKYTQAGKIDYVRIFEDGRVHYSIVGRQKLDFLGDEISRISDEYLNSLENYHKNLIETLQKANELSTDKTKIAQKIESLNKQYKNLRSSFEQNLDLKTMRSRIAEVPKY
ncbi:hypothetical protein [Raineya orbicola]|uniref:Uncharacterized protein n=1 Tax=Raineya orbicola TaxID=2016530 RepID=A0A2N3IJI7_9BACT|nr:hypothetical protein [Raineya orbicola]PKQ70431.1 hypothetical protein Rain11_0514 [Raineya orbicola]